MLKRIVIFLKTRGRDMQQPSNLFIHRFNADDSQADQYQWNGGRYLTTKELQCINKELNPKLTAQHVS